MWIFTRDGLLSAIDCGQGKVMVRARRRDHLVTFRARHGWRQKIRHTKVADYQWRIIITKPAWAKAMWEEAVAVDYPNFKEAAAETGAWPPGLLTWIWGKAKIELEKILR